MIVQMRWYEVQTARTVGVIRHASSQGKRDPRNDAPDEPEKSCAMHIMGALGEMAVAKALNLYWHASINEFTGLADVGHNVQVRATDTEYLILREHDNDEQVFVMIKAVPYRHNVFEIFGYMKAGEGKKPQFWYDKNGRTGAWFVPKKLLKRIEDADYEEVY